MQEQERAKQSTKLHDFSFTRRLVNPALLGPDLDVGY